MRFIPFIMLFFVSIVSLDAMQTPKPSAATTPTPEQSAKPIAIAIHGGAGTIRRSAMTPEKEAQYRAVLTQALYAGHEVLKRGGNALDAVSAAVMIMEDSPLFNAGKGAVLTAEGAVELDAAIMDGSNLKAGAVCGVRGVKNPIVLARRVMDKTAHVMLTGKGAERFAEEQGFERMPDAYFITERRAQELQRAQQNTTQKPLPPDETPGSTTPRNTAPKRDSSQQKRSEALPGQTSQSQRNQKSVAYNDTAPLEEGSHEGKKFGTVGAVALDKNGNIAAATSTGGMTNKKYGRVGDAPIIGAGTYANNVTCAVSATGHGEYFIRSVVAHDIAALIEYKQFSLERAADEVVMKKLVERGGSGGIIAIDGKGNIAMPFNSEGMYRGCITADGKIRVEIFRSEEK
ncbi:MAG: isoaspartyl peptidase/L-asparaginase [Candidatus Kapabacteria bacterium]|jgi:beta-aspartyl-peptidase (threonine type)|nr:isoaspartyl peptidase/L-asparaginase [Candidatus Kapabacteria bacterium]